MFHYFYSSILYFIIGNRDMLRNSIDDPSSKLRIDQKSSLKKLS